MASESPPIAPETEIAGFRVKALLGEGAMARVYLAHDMTLGRRVALKLFKRAADGAAEEVLREARATAALDHPNIVHIYQTGTFDGLPFLALEFIDGETLRDRLRQGALPAAEALRIAHAVAEALVAAHQRGYVHGDVKPENVLIASSGRVRLVDFGLAKTIGVATLGAGTAEYMAPERWLKAELTPAVDVWALGVLLHELVSGRQPFTTERLVAAVYANAQLSLDRGDGAEALPDVVKRCLAWDPAARPSARGVADELRQLLRGDTPSPQAPFRGLTAFAEADAADFCGRDDDTLAALERLRRATLLTIVGPSGVGKSSFVRARVVPRLREAGPCAVCYVRPGGRPLVSLVQGLGATLDPERTLTQVQTLRRYPDRLRLMLADCVRAHGGQRVVLILDQLEEALTLAGSDESAAFFAALAAAAQETGAPWRVIALVRDDFLGRIYQTQLGDHLDAVLPLRPLRVDELEAAVREPVRRSGYDFEPRELPTRIALEVAHQPAPLPLLQFACHALWERRDRERALLTGSAYDLIGGAVGALVREGEQLLATLSPAERAIARALLLSLTSPDGTRVPGVVARLKERLGPEIAPLTERFVAHRLLSIRSDGEQAVIELAHESLAALWPELRRWLDESSEARRLLRDVEEAAALWQRRGRSRAETWRGATLAGVLARLQGAGVAPSQRAQEFLAESQAEDARAGRLRRRVWGGFLLLMVAFATTATFFALRFREDEKRALSQREQLRIAAENMGEVELTLAPFDWDSEHARVVPIGAAQLPELTLRLWRAAPANPEQPRLDAPLPLRDLRRTVDDAGLRLAFSAPGGDALVELRRRGRAGESCASSWVRLRAMPGYLEQRRGERLSLRIAVPSCQASRAELVTIPAGEFLMPGKDGDTRQSLPAFAIDRTELSNARFAPFGELLGAMGYEHVWPPDTDELHGAAGAAFPVTGLDAAAARALCRYFGEELPTRAEWVKAFRGPADGPDAAAPRPLARLAALAHVGAGDGPRPVAARTADRSPFGVLGLTGNIREWTATVDDSDARQSQIYVAGGDWLMPRAELPRQLFANSNHPRSVSFTLGLRCVVRPNATAAAAAVAAPAGTASGDRRE
jgi:formylglycine-generating enzyme required for sulfatase activity